MRLEGKVAVVTGAMQGIGAGISSVLANNGAHVVLTDISEKVAETAKRIDGSTSFKIMDVTDPDMVSIVFKEILEEHGKERTLCATALFQMASFYERLGRPEAVDVFQRLMEEYPDQTDQAYQARARMEALQGVAAPARGASVPPDPTYTLLAEN